MEFLLGGDIITDLNGQSLNDAEKFVELIRSLKVGDRIHLTLYREKKTRKVEFILPERPILPHDLRFGSSGRLLPI
jgi:S1-C subfamily serine protease